MGLSAKAKSSNEGWGLGLFLVFFPDDEAKYIDKRKKLSYSSSTSSTSSSFGSGYTGLLYTRAQLTLSICVIIVFFTLFLFALSTLERTVPTISSPTTRIELSFPRRWLAEKNYKEGSKSKKFMSMSRSSLSSSSSSSSFALQGMGTRFRRGTKAMSDLVVAHLTEDTREDHLRLFLRTLHRSGLTSRADVLFIFPSPLISPNFTTIIHQENESFLRLIHSYRTQNVSVGFDLSQFVKSDKKEKQGSEPLWGLKAHTNHSNPEGQRENSKSNAFSWGSVVSFEAAELDPENSLSGFLDNPPMRLRRWACYPMLLGRVRRNFKHVMLADVKDVVVFGDALSRVRTRSSELVSLWTIPSIIQSNKRVHGRKNSEKSHQSQLQIRKESKSVTADVITGGIRGVRRLSNAMVNEIVRAALQQRKSKAPLSDSAILNQLVRNDSLLKSINIITTESQIPEATSLIMDSDLNSSLPFPFSSAASVSMVTRANTNFDLVDVIFRQICSSTIDSSVYSDC